MEKALKAHRKAIESLYTGAMTVYVSSTQTNPVTHVEDEVETELYADIPCRLSYKSKGEAAILNDMTASASREVDVFVSPDVFIPGGSRMSVVWQGKELELRRSGVSELHNTHNKYTAEIIKEHL